MNWNSWDKPQQLQGLTVSSTVTDHTQIRHSACVGNISVMSSQPRRCECLQEQKHAPCWSLVLNSLSFVLSEHAHQRVKTTFTPQRRIFFRRTWMKRMTLVCLLDCADPFWSEHFIINAHNMDNFYMHYFYMPINLKQTHLVCTTASYECLIRIHPTILSTLNS